MHYEIIDNNKEKWIVLLHCICSNMHVFDTCIDELSKKHNILLIDLPGHGQSREYKGKIDFKEVSAEIVKILDNLQIEKFTIWGISLGGVIAKYLLKIVPGRIEKIIFESPAFMIENKFNLFLFKVFNRIKGILPKGIYLRAFIYAVIPGKKQKNIRIMMYKHLRLTDYKIISKWLTELCNEYKNKDFEILNSSEIEKVYVLGEYDYIFKKGTTENVKENRFNKIIIKKDCGHLCHLECEICL